MVKVKICGITCAFELSKALNAKSDLVGFLVGITHKAEDQIPIEKARTLVKMVPPSIQTVAVTHLQAVDKIVEMTRFLGVSTLQLHEYLSPEEVSVIKSSLKGIEIIKAIHVSDETAVEEAMKYKYVADFLLLDTKTADRIGGTGLTHDWNISKKLWNYRQSLFFWPVD